MKLYSENKSYKLYQGSMLDMLEVIKPNSIDSIITDPPYELNFMNKGWDNSGIAFQSDTWKKCYEVLKPGGYLLAFGGSRTFHRIACAIEDAGFEIRDTIMWLYGSGFPKSMDISKQIDKRPNRSYENLNLFGKKLKEQRELKGYSKNDIDKMMGTNTAYAWWEGRNYLGEFKIQLPDKENYKKLKEILELNDDMDFIFEEAEREVIGQKEKLESYQYKNNNVYQTNGDKEKITLDITIPSTELAKQWQGWGTCLKPSFEPIIVARKPFKGSLVDNVIEYGVGGINIDECRIETIDILKEQNNDKNSLFGGIREDNSNGGKYIPSEQGRFPANTILTYDDTDFSEVCGEFPNTNGGKRHNTAIRKSDKNSGYGFDVNTRNEFNDSGSASRYFMNCKYTGKDEEIWKQLLVSNVGNNLEILKATKDNIVQMNVEDLLKELKDHYAKYVGNQLDLIETSIVQDIVEMLTWDFKIETSQVIQDFIINSKKCIQFLNLVQFVEKMDNIDTTQTTQNLLKLFGYVKVVITNYILGNIEYDQKRYIYTPKASKKDRDEGLDEFEIKGAKELLNRKENSDGASWNGKYSSGNAYAGAGCPKKNTHPTVKPTELMQYLVRLVSPNGATILDPFNGSGSTGKAVMYENKERNKNYKYIGIELTEEYLPIAKARIEYVCNLKEEKLKDMQMSIFDL